MKSKKDREEKREDRIRGETEIGKNGDRGRGKRRVRDMIEQNKNVCLCVYTLCGSSVHLRIKSELLKMGY